jgi:hypothetical protein
MKTRAPDFPECRMATSTSYTSWRRRVGEPTGCCMVFLYRQGWWMLERLLWDGWCALRRRPGIVVRSQLYVAGFWLCTTWVATLSDKGCKVVGSVEAFQQGRSDVMSGSGPRSVETSVVCVWLCCAAWAVGSLVVWYCSSRVSHGMSGRRPQKLVHGRMQWARLRRECQGGSLERSTSLHLSERSQGLLFP